MRHHEGSLEGPRGETIYHQSWLPDEDPRAVLVLVHGLAEHSGRYGRVVEALAPQGYAIYACDQIGHGKSSGRRVYVERFEEFSDTLDRHLSDVRKAHPVLPVFLYGHSVGALIVCFHLLDHPRAAHGIVLSGPCVKISSNISSATVLAAKVLSRIAPKLGVSAIDACGISRDPVEVEAYNTDPLIYRGKTTARLGMELLRAMRRVEAHGSSIDVPTLLLQGSGDTIVDASGAQMLYDTFATTDKTLRIYDGLFHEVHNEPEHQQVLSEVLAWLNARLQ